MPLDRRAFLELASGWIGGNALSGGAYRAIHDDCFVATDLELALRKPHNWIFIPPETVALEATDIGRAASTGGMDPSVMNISKTPWASNPKRFTPGINIWTKPSGIFDHPSECCYSLAASQSFYRDYQITTEPQPVALQDGEAWQCGLSFTFDTLGIDRPTPLRCRAVAIEQASHFIQMLFSDSPSSGFDESLTFDQFLYSLRHVPQA